MLNMRKKFNWNKKKKTFCALGVRLLSYWRVKKTYRYHAAHFVVSDRRLRALWQLLEIWRKWWRWNIKFRRRSKPTFHVTIHLEIHIEFLPHHKTLFTSKIFPLHAQKMGYCSLIIYHSAGSYSLIFLFFFSVCWGGN